MGQPRYLQFGLLCSTSLSLGLGLLLLPQASVAVPPPLLLAQTDVVALLKALPTPGTIKGRVGDLAYTNAYGNKAINFQTAILAEPAATFYQTSLPKLGYKEREINRVVGSWGFNLVFDTPENFALKPQSNDKKVVLVLQGTLVGANTLNVNIRFEEI